MERPTPGWLVVQENKEDITNKDGGSVQHKHELTLHFMSEGFKSEGKDAIDMFIELTDEAYKWHLDQLRTLLLHRTRWH